MADPSFELILLGAGPGAAMSKLMVVGFGATVWLASFYRIAGYQSVTLQFLNRPRKRDTFN